MVSSSAIVDMLDKVKMEVEDTLTRAWIRLSILMEQNSHITYSESLGKINAEIGTYIHRIQSNFSTIDSRSIIPPQNYETVVYYLELSAKLALVSMVLITVSQLSSSKSSRVWSTISSPAAKLLYSFGLPKETVRNPKCLALSNSIKGTKVHVKNVEPMFEGWPFGEVNPCYGKLTPVVEAKIASLGFKGKKLEKFRHADLALFVSTWWPKASFDSCVTIVYWIIWLFVWDDEIDLEENVVGNDFSEAQIFRQQTLKFIEYSLGFGDQSKGEPVSPNIIISSFRELGQRLRAQYNERQRQSFLDEVTYYIEMTQLEQETKFSDTLPTVEEYWAMRMGSSAVKPCLVMAEMAIDYELPAYVRECPEMAVLWDETTIGISMSNDILSLKKELRSDGILSQVPLSMVQHGLTVQEAVDVALVELQESIDRLNEASKRIVLLAPEGSPDHKAIKAYVDVMRTNQGGHHYWSIRSGRYFIPGTVRKDGSIDISL